MIRITQVVAFGVAFRRTLLKRREFVR
jgi:hypothetical protein